MSNKIITLTKFKFREIFRNKSNVISILIVVLLTFAFKIIYGNLGKDADAETSLFLSNFVLSIGVLYSVGMIALNLPAANLAKDKEKNTLRTLMTSSITGLEYFLSSIIPVIVISIGLCAAIIFISGFPIEKINMPLYFFITTIAAITSAIIGMIIGLFAKNQVAASTIITPVMLVILMIPLLSSMSKGLKKVSDYLYTGVLNNMINSFSSEKAFSLSALNYVILFGSIILATLAFIYIYKKNGYEKD